MRSSRVSSSPGSGNAVRKRRARPLVCGAQKVLREDRSCSALLEVARIQFSNISMPVRFFVLQKGKYILKNKPVPKHSLRCVCLCVCVQQLELNCNPSRAGKGGARGNSPLCAQRPISALCPNLEAGSLSFSGDRGGERRGGRRGDEEE